MINGHPPNRFPSLLMRCIMFSMLIFQLVLVLVLVLLNGVFALAEMAVVSSRPARLKGMQERGVKGAGRALALAADPGRFLSTVQVGITLIGVVAGAVSGASLGASLGAWFGAMGVPRHYADPIGFALVVTAITYVSLIVGELVPKQVALRNPEAIACKLAPLMMMLSRVATPFVWFLDKSGQFLLQLLRLQETAAVKVTDEEIKSLIAEAQTSGVIESGERDMIAGVMRLGDRPVRAVMTPRTQIDFVDLSQTQAAIAKVIVASVHSRFPVHDGDPEKIIGIVQAKDIADILLAEKKLDIAKLVHEAPIIPETLNALEAIELLRDSSIHLGLVHDEYGHFLGVVTATDILGSIVGNLASGEDDDREAHQRPDGSWLIPGGMPADELAELLGIKLPAKRQYETVAGLVVDRLKHLPSLGQSVTFKGWRLEVIDLDGRRVDKVLVQALPKAHRAKT